MYFIFRTQCSEKTVKFVLVAIMSALFAGMAPLLAANKAEGAAYGAIHGFAESGNWRQVTGSIDTPNPSSLDNWSHKHYMIYFTDGLTPFTAGAGIFIFKNSASDPIVKCYLRLFINDNPTDNANVITCSPSPSGTVSLKVEQTTDNGYTYKGTSGSYTYTYAYTNSQINNPVYFGAVSTGSTNNLIMYSFLSNLKMKNWGGTTYNFADADNYKCYVDSGYKYNNQNYNAYLSGPPAVTVQECTIQQDQYRPHAEWD